MRRNEARALLQAAREGERRAQRLFSALLGQLLALWGAVYLVGYGAEALGRGSPALWTGLVLGGFLLSFALGWGQRQGLKTPAGGQIGRIWAGFGLAYLALNLAGPRFTGGGFSVAVNLLVALAWMASGAALARPAVFWTGAVYALAEGLFAGPLAGGYLWAHALLGLAALGYGLYLAGHGR